MLTLQDLYENVEEYSDEYEIARNEKIEQITNYIRDYLSDPNTAISHAKSVMASAEEMGRIKGDMVHGEIRRMYTKSGTPLSFSI